ncbi:unnamed protein product [Didymodactylos carnosus]|uniref:Mitogen-activated protein kinase n=1 Tax=Didymodactylos carnosus TaxID=1234261 RepID=A0A814M384_9BILA|nr:unnamed protein product [Didymodactylos carnosus]CAF3839419.1 unnamed protein product [Didymodactylos carnosus]
MDDHFSKKFLDVTFELSSTKYEAVENIGNGAYGVVCLALNKKTGDNVAIKKIADVFKHCLLAKRTFREIKILKYLKHENIIAIRDIFTTNKDNETEVEKEQNTSIKDVYIVFDYMYTDLQKIMQSNQVLSIDHIKYVYYTCQHYIIHRDLKPSNILVNQTCDLKIADFGMARQYRQHDQTQYVVTRWYRAPEVILGYTEYNQSIDIWSAGCILAEMFGRKPLFSGADTLAQLKLIFVILGTPSKQFLNSLHSDVFRRIILSAGSNREPVNFQKLYPNASSQGIDLLCKMLIVDPVHRISAENTLKHDFIKEFVTDNDQIVKNESFDFTFERQNWTVEQVKNAILEEVQSFRQSNYRYKTNDTKTNEKNIGDPLSAETFCNKSKNDTDLPSLSPLEMDRLFSKDTQSKQDSVIIIDSPSPIEKNSTVNKILEIDPTRLLIKRKYSKRCEKHLQRKRTHQHFNDNNKKPVVVTDGVCEEIVASP